MKEQFKKAVDSTKEYWGKQPKKKRMILGSLLIGTLFFAVLVTVLLNIPKIGYTPIFPGMTSEESAQVFATLQGMDVQPEINKKGEVLVPSDQWDSLVFQLAGKGFPKTTLSYDTFLNNSGFTTTEYDKKQASLFQLQDRMQQTLVRQEGIEDAVVTFTIPESSNRIWDQTNEQESTAGVQIKMKPGYELTPERVTAVKNLAATAVPKMKAKNVIVVDAATGVQMPGVDDAGGAGFYSVQRMKFEREVAKALEDNIKRLLAPKYGPDGVTAVATVKFNYDAMKTEAKEYKPKDDGNGVPNHFEERYSGNGANAAQGLAGEENNTDVPQYPNQDVAGANGVSDYEKIIDYDIDYVLTQTEKGEPLLTGSMVSVIVNDAQFDTARQEILVDLISKGTGISPENVTVTNLDFAESGQPATNPNPDAAKGLKLNFKMILIIAIAGLLLLLIIIFIITRMLHKSKRRKLDAEEQAYQEAEEQRQHELEREISDHKRMLQEEAQSSSSMKDNAITEEVRSFAKDNPEITANLIRSLLKEEK